MPGCRVTGRFVLVSSMMLAGGWAHAQEAAATPPAPAAPACSGLSCIFGSPLPERSRAAASAPAETVQPVQPVVQVASPSQEPAPSELQPAAQKARPKPVKPVHPITIAAGAAEIGRVKALVAAFPRHKIRVVAERGAEADLSVATSLDRPAGAEKAKLFTEEMHVVAGGAIRTVADLRDKVVSFGTDGSTSQATARKAFAALRIPVKETPLDLDNALDGLATGDIAAVVVLAPQPDERLKRISTPGLHLLAWPTDGTLPAGALYASIDGGRYPHLAAAGDTIPAVGLDAVLTVSAKGARRPETKAFLTALSQHSAALSRRGFDLLKADIESRADRRVASAERH